MVSRHSLLQNMQKNSDRGIDCSKCSGRCCTFERNSMKITRAEAQELYQYLLDKKLFNTQLEKKLYECIEKFRLNVEIVTKKNSLLRRTYTCPFFLEDTKRCSIAPEVKPLGCLAYNPQDLNAQGENCASQEELLEAPTREAHELYPDEPKWTIPEYLLILQKETISSGAKMTPGSN